MAWEKVKLGDICAWVASGGTPLTSKADYYSPKEIPWLKTQEVNYCRIYETNNQISKKGLENSSAKLIPANAVIVAMYGQGDTAGRVAINKIPLCTNQACCNLVIDENKADYEFVYYNLCTLYDKLVSLKNGGAQPNLNAGLIKNLEISLPPLSTQKRIADILSAYDNLIENNQKQIKLLEEAAQRLYKQWFIDLRFPGHETTKIVDGLPEGWRKGSIGDIAEFKRGKVITKGDVVEGNVPVVAGGLEPAYYHNASFTESPVITVSGSGANAGFARMYFQKIWASDCSYVDSSATIFIYFVYSFLKENKKSLDSLQKGAAQPHVYAKDINALKLNCPPKDLLVKFEKSVKPLFDKIGKCQNVIEKSKDARDRLLPKLMSKKMEV
ncbi:restriction endonuclease subunit S [Hallerella porci]|uniref:Type I restriction enzyme S subunit n=1 Tax=Hallerella porci TaxID=1945871 RepID=A0ABX5LLJ3_9BACT|nr:restriction endonuclease subunit S [Hallerella porci]PWK98197.1 type I restriction enzyme S subunit [Hallerella porci]